MNRIINVIQIIETFVIRGRVSRVDINVFCYLFKNSFGIHYTVFDRLSTLEWNDNRLDQIRKRVHSFPHINVAVGGYRASNPEGGSFSTAEPVFITYRSLIDFQEMQSETVSGQKQYYNINIIYLHPGRDPLLKRYKILYKIILLSTLHRHISSDFLTNETYQILLHFQFSYFITQILLNIFGVTTLTQKLLEVNLSSTRSSLLRGWKIRLSHSSILSIIYMNPLRF